MPEDYYGTGLKLHTCLLVAMSVLIGGCIARSVIGVESTQLKYKKYNEVVGIARKTEKTVFVLISAEWCPPCKQLKLTLDRLHGRGELKKHDFASLDFDKERKEARRLMGDASAIPQLLAMKWSSKNGWSLQRRVGAGSEERVLEWIRKVSK